MFCRVMFFLSLFLQFDVQVFESAIEKISKPDPKAYTTVLERLNVEATDAVFLDDIGRNCKAASQLGIRAIKVGVMGWNVKSLYFVDEATKLINTVIV